ncbi:MAG: hypothetical protein IPO09_18970, partial [Anaeromyxobacter sp.]|nr:hypothetical protein [Anaeromyxobacter sp.]
MPRAIYEDSEPLLRPASGFAAARTLVPNAPTMVASAAAVKAAAITRAAPPSVYQTPPVLAPAATGDALVAGIISNAMVPTAVGAAATVLGAVGKTSPPTVRAIDAGWTPPSFGTPNAGAANPTPLPSSPPEPTI